MLLKEKGRGSSAHYMSPGYQGLEKFTGILNQYIELEFRKRKMYGCHEINKFVVTIYRIAGGLGAQR